MSMLLKVKGAMVLGQIAAIDSKPEVAIRRELFQET
jgi:hypothetical protein